MGHAPPLRLVVLAAALALCLGGCGRRGTLEPPPGTSTSQLRDSSNAGQAQILKDQDPPGLIQSPDKVFETSAAAQQQVLTQPPAPPPINRPPPPRPNTFVLDPLL